MRSCLVALLMLVGGSACLMLLIGLAATPREDGHHATVDPAPAPQEPQLSDEDRALQPEREELIRKMMREGIFSKLERASSSMPHLWVGPKFHLASFGQKSSFVSVVYAYCLVARDGKDVHIILKEDVNGRRIGEWAKAYGGLRMH